MRNRALWTLVAIACMSGTAQADDLEDKGFGLRLSAALTRASRYPDSMAIGGAGGGSPWSSSPNPASSGLNPSVGSSGWGASGCPRRSTSSSSAGPVKTDSETGKRPSSSASRGSSGSIAAAATRMFSAGARWMDSSLAN